VSPICGNLETAPKRRGFSFISITCRGSDIAIFNPLCALAKIVDIGLTLPGVDLFATHRCGGPAGGMKPVQSLPAKPA
jgi:hypothetical protein